MVGGESIGDYTERFSTVARSANYLCEPFARLAIVIGQKRQDLNETQYDYFAFAWHDMEMSWVAEAVASSMPKVFFADLAGELVASLEIEKTMVGVAQSFDLSGLKVFAAEWGARFLGGSITTALIAPPARVVQDFTARVTQDAWAAAFGHIEHTPHILCTAGTTQTVEVPSVKPQPSLPLDSEKEEVGYITQKDLGVSLRSDYEILELRNTARCNDLDVSTISASGFPIYEVDGTRSTGDLVEENDASL